MIVPKVYMPETDKIEDVTQEWCDKATDRMRCMFRMRMIVAAICRMDLTKSADREIIDQIDAILGKPDR